MASESVAASLSSSPEGRGRPRSSDEEFGRHVPRWVARAEKGLHPGLHVVQAGGGPEGCILPHWVWSSLPTRKGRRAQQQSRAHHAWCSGRAGVGARVRRSRPGERRGAQWVPSTRTRRRPRGGIARCKHATTKTPARSLKRRRRLGCAITLRNAPSAPEAHQKETTF